MSRTASRTPLFLVVAGTVLMPAAMGGQPAFAQAAQAGPQRVSISVDDCRKLVRHVPAADVAYKPGVDVHGNKVAPADLPGSGATMDVLPKVIEFNYTINPSKWNAQQSGNTGIISNSMASVAAIRYDLLSNTLTINGQPVGGSDEQAIAEECRKRGVK